MLNTEHAQDYRRGYGDNQCPAAPFRVDFLLFRSGGKYFQSPTAMVYGDVGALIDLGRFAAVRYAMALEAGTLNLTVDEIPNPNGGE